MSKKILILSYFCIFSIINIIGQNRVSVRIIKPSETVISNTTFYHPDSINYDSLGVLSYNEAFSIVENNANNKIIKHLSNATLSYTDSLSHPIWKFHSWNIVKRSPHEIKVWNIHIDAINGELIKVEKSKELRTNINF
jgi:hypothetical protein